MVRARASDQPHSKRASGCWGGPVSSSEPGRSYFNLRAHSRTLSLFSCLEDDVYNDVCSCDLLLEIYVACLQVRLLAEKEKGGEGDGSGSVLIHLRFFRDKDSACKLGLPPMQEKELADSGISGSDTGKSLDLSF